jgi:hypothetical protein
MERLLKDMTNSNKYKRSETVSIKQTDVRIARDRIQATLSPYLGSNLALERANNIAQALMMGSDDIRSITSEMLRNTGIEDIDKLASQIVRAWYLATTRI